MIARAALLAVALALGACAPAPAQRQQVVGDGAGPTFVSLNPCADAILAEVADPEQILAISQFSRDPGGSSMGVAAASRFAATSGTVEELVALSPNIVIGDAFVPGPASTSALARLGLRLERFPIEPDVATSRAQVRWLAKLAGHPQRGEALVARIDRALAAAAPPAGAAPLGAVVWQGGGIVPGERTLIADLLHRTGFRNFSATRGLGQADVLPLERMLADPPRVILAAGHPGADENRLLFHPALAALDQTRRERFPSALLWCGGPTIPAAAARLARVREAAAPR